MTPTCTAWTLPTQSSGQASISTISKRSSPPIAVARERRRVIGASIERQHEADMPIGFRPQRRQRARRSRATRYAPGRRRKRARPEARRAASVCPKRSVGTIRIVRSTRYQMNPHSRIVATGPTHTSDGEGDPAANAESSRPSPPARTPPFRVAAPIHLGPVHLTFASIHACAGSLWKCQTRCGPAITFR